MARKRSWTDEQLRAAVALSTSYKAVLELLGLVPQGGSHWNVRRRVRDLDLDTTHFNKSRTAPWTEEELRVAIAGSTSWTETLVNLGRDPANGLYQRLQRETRRFLVDTSHFNRRPGARNRARRWSDDQLRHAVAASHGYASTIRNLGLIPAGGNYDHVKRRIDELALDTSHFRGMGWNVGRKFNPAPELSIDQLLQRDRWTASHHLKKRLFKEGLKKQDCELCGWAQRAPDGRLPLELDHINGDRNDNRIENLRILCPNCHALQPTHRGLNQRRRRS